MSVSAVGGSGQSNVQLQAQLKKDQQALAADKQAHAAQKVLQLEHVKVEMGESMISAAAQAQADNATAQSPAASAPAGSTADGSIYL
jgi:hypothetical protein